MSFWKQNGTARNAENARNAGTTVEIGDTPGNVTEKAVEKGNTGGNPAESGNRARNVEMTAETGGKAGNTEGDPLGERRFAVVIPAAGPGKEDSQASDRTTDPQLEPEFDPEGNATRIEGI